MPGYTREDLIDKFVANVLMMEGRQMGTGDRAFYLDLITKVANAVDGQSHQTLEDMVTDSMPIRPDSPA